MILYKTKLYCYHEENMDQIMCVHHKRKCEHQKYNTFKYVKIKYSLANYKKNM